MFRQKIFFNLGFWRPPNLPSLASRDVIKVMLVVYVSSGFIMGPEYERYNVFGKPACFLQLLVFNR